VFSFLNLALAARRFARSYNGPSAGEVDLVETQLLLTILVANAGVNVVVVQNRAKLWVPDNTLTTRAVDPAVGLEHSSTTAVGAAFSALINKAAGRALGPTDLDAVLLAGGRLVGVEAAALANREEKVVVVAALGDEGAFLGVRAGGLEGDVRRGGGRLQGWVGHFGAEDVVPERPEGHDELGAVPVKGAVDGVVVVAGLGRDAGGTVVRPRVHVL
jgi:hypothetical protein